VRTRVERALDVRDPLGRIDLGDVVVDH